MSIMEYIGVSLLLFTFALMLLGPIVCHFYTKYANDIKWEKLMKPCPKCGHRAITVHYTGENNPYFFTAECGAYVRRGEDNIGTVGEINTNGLPPLTEEQKKCNFYAGYCSDAPHFATRKGAVMWWNRMVEQEGR